MTAPAIDPADRLIDPQGAGLRLGVNAETLKRWRSKGTGPRYVRVARSRVRYRVRDLDDWLDAHTVTPGAPAARQD
jgi:predicted DNA-binding transcriptional regulator AlpA